MASEPAFDRFVAELRPKLARAYLAAYGPERAQEALSEAMAYAWEHFDRLAVMDNPAGYLWRVGQSRSRRRRHPMFPSPGLDGIPDIEPGLVPALRQLSERQRVCVVLVFAFEWTHEEVAQLLGLSRSSVQNHVERGVKGLRRRMGATTDA